MSSQSNQTEKILCDAVARNAGVVLSLPSTENIHNIKSRFLAQGDEGIWVQIGSDAIRSALELVQNQEPLAISFKVARQRVTFAARMLRVNTAFPVNERTAVPSVLVEKPTEINVVQRRSAYRVTVAPDSGLSVRIWPIEDRVYLGDRPLASKEIKVEVVDLSAGGLGIHILRQRLASQQLTGGQRLRVQIKYQDIDLLLDARLRFSTKRSKELIPAGVLFKKLDSDVESRQKLAALTRIIGNLQQEEIRRTRLKMAS